jgi:hypothetical protein
VTCGRNKGDKKKIFNPTTMDGLKSAELLKMENMMDRKKNPIVADLGTIINFSPKVDLIESIIRQLGVDYQGNPGQAILFTYSSRRGLREPLRRSYAAGGRSQHPIQRSATRKCTALYLTASIHK